MLSFYMLLFFLFSTSAVATPIKTGGRAAGQVDISVPADNAANGYWVLKKPQGASYFSDKVLKIEGKDFRFFELDGNFQIVLDSEHAVDGHEMPFLAGVWHEVPLHNSVADHRFRELTIEEESNTITLKLASTKASQSPSGLPPPLGSHSLSRHSLHIANGYWVLGDATEAVPEEAWRKILYIEDGKCSTFKLDDKFHIISPEDMVRPSVGDYFRIPFEGMEHLRPLFSQQGDSEFYRFVVLRIRKTAEGQIFTRVQYLDTNRGSDSE